MIKRKNKAILCAIASIALVNTAVTVPASAMNNGSVVEAKSSTSKKEMVVKVNDLNVRAGSSTKHKVLGKLNKGDKVTVVQTLSNGWVKIEYKGGFGYVSNVKGAYLGAVSNSKPESKKEMVAKVNDLNVRAGSSTKHKVLGKLNKGDKVTVVQTLSNGWVKIEYKGGFGYVSNVKGAYLEVVSSSNPGNPSGPSTPDNQKIEMVAKVNDLNVRAGSSTKHKVLGKLNKGDKVTVVQTLSNGWVKIEYKGGFGYVSNVKGAYLQPVVNTQDKENADKVIALINSLNANITLADKADVVKAREAYNALSEKAKALVTNLNKLTDAEKEIAKLEKEKNDIESSQEVISIIDDINALTNVSLNDKDLIVKARTAYNNLSAEAKAMVTPESLAILEEAEKEIARLEKEKEDIESSQKVADIIAEIKALGSVTLDDKDLVVKARTAYDNLNPEAKAMISQEDLTTLENAENELVRLQVEADKASAKAVEDRIATLDRDLTYADGELVRIVRAEYNALTSEAKAYVTNLNILEEAENEIKGIIENVNSVIELMQLIPSELNITHKDQIEEARNAYDNLRDVDKVDFPQNVLEIFEIQEDEMQKIVEKFDNAVQLMEALPQDIELSHKAQVEEARNAYEALSDADKNEVEVSLVEKLENAEFEIKKLEIIDSNPDAKDVISDIEALPALDSISTSNKDEIYDVMARFRALPDDVKSVVDATALFEAFNKVETLLAEEIDEEIMNLPAYEYITLANKSAIEDLRNRYDALDDSNKDKVTHIDILELAEVKIAELEFSFGSATVDNVIAQIDALPEVADIQWHHDDEIANVKYLYDNLSSSDQALVRNYNKLVDVENELNRIQAGINDVLTAIHKIPALEDLTLSDKQIVVDARNAYDSYDKKITYYINQMTYGDLINAEIKIEKLEQLESDPIAKDLAQRIEALLNKELTLADKDEVYGLRDTYKSLSPESQKAIDINLISELEERMVELEHPIK